MGSIAVIYEDKNFLAFLDIEPVSEGHILVIPKTHVVWMQELLFILSNGILEFNEKCLLTPTNLLTHPQA